MMHDNNLVLHMQYGYWEDNITTLYMNRPSRVFIIGSYRLSNKT